MDKITVLGAGTWGIALARLLAVNGHDVTVWSALPEELKELRTTRRHKNLPGMELPETMHYTADIAEAAADRDACELEHSVGPESTAAFRAALARMKE